MIDHPQGAIIAQQANAMIIHGRLSDSQRITLTELIDGRLMISDRSGEDLIAIAVIAGQCDLAPLFGYLEMQAAWVRAKTNRHAR